MRLPYINVSLYTQKISFLLATIKMFRLPLLIGTYLLFLNVLLFSYFFMHLRTSETKVLSASIGNVLGDKPLPIEAGSTRSAVLTTDGEQHVTDIVSSIQATDARAALIDRFLEYYNSPMLGHGDDFVRIADKYGLDYRLLPAIALKESGVGKIIPPGSYNAWGWAVYTGQQSGAEFDSWEHGIETVAKGLRKGYVDDGLITPEKIMPRYAPPSSSWADSVRAAMNQISEN